MSHGSGGLGSTLGGEHALECGRCAGSAGAGARREPFAFPGTTRKYARDRVVDVRHIRLDITVDPAQRRIAGTARHTVAAIAAGCDRLVLDAAELTVEGVTDGDGKALAYELVDGVLSIRLGKALAEGETTDVIVAYRGSPRRGLYFIAPDEAYPDKPVQAWTQGQDEDARFWFPCFDYPNEKASTEVVVTSPSKYTTLSNGALVEKRPGGTKGTTTWHWKMALPQVTYLVTLVVGEFDEVSLGGDRVPLPALLPKGQGKDAQRCLGRTAEMVKAFEARFGVPYPYEKYAQVVVADFIFGGMENTTATTLTEYALYDERAALDYDADDLISHELAHQWWGDLLTCRDWSHAWLNEGFATWCETIFREHHLGVEEAAWHALAAAKAYFAEDGGEYRRAIVCKDYEEPIDVFDRHLYQKASWVLRMLRAELGEDGFWASIRRYANTNAQRTVVTDDLRRAIEDATGRNMEGFLDQWIYGAGHPEIKASWSWDEKTNVATVRVEQTQKGDDKTADAFRGTMTVELVAGEKTERRRLAITERVHAFHLSFAARPDVVRFDPDAEWLASWTFDVGLDAHRKALATDPTIAGRIRAANALAKDSSAETVAALARAVKGDKFWGVSAEAAAALGDIRTPAAREALLAVRKDVKHPKARRAVVAALGAFRGDEAAAEALREVLAKGDASLFVEAEAAEALGRTRTPGAKAAIERALATKSSWADSIRAGCVRGLGLLASEDVVDTLVGQLAWGKHSRVRMAAAGSLAQIGSRLVVRDGIRDRLEALIDDRDFRVQMAGIAALRAMGDDRAIPALRRGAEQAIDGRVKRACRGAARRLEQRAERTSEVGKLSDAVETLRREVAVLSDRLRKSEARPGAGAKAKSAAKPTPVAKSKPAARRKRR
jgi:aminopeptidase N